MEQEQEVTLLRRITGSERRIIAVDGPARSGKGTTAKMLADHYGLMHVDSGSIYRAVAYLSIRLGVRPTEEAELAVIASTIGESLMGSDDIRSPIVNELVPQIAKYPLVRRVVNLKQYWLVSSHDRGAVVEGRDIASKVFPNAQIKCFLSASARARAEREYKRLGKTDHTVEQIESSIVDRDHADMTRAADPLVRHPDAFFVDSTNLNPQEVFDLIVRHIESKFSNF